MTMLSKLQNKLTDVFAVMSPSEKAQALSDMEETVMAQAAELGPDEFIKTARKLGYDIDVSLRKADNPDVQVSHHYKHLQRNNDILNA